MKTIESKTYRYTPAQPATGLSSHEVAISQSLSIRQAGPWFLSELLIDWQRVEADQVPVVATLEWTLARIIKLAELEANSGWQALLRFVDGDIEIGLDVHNLKNVAVAELVFNSSREGYCKWRGVAESYTTARAVVKEFEEVLLAQPDLLGKFELKAEVRVPMRAGAANATTLGWTGNRFLGQHLVQRPSYARRRESPRPSPRTQFTISEIPVAENGPKRNRSKRPQRYTAVWPPAAALEEIPNWTYASSEEGRAGQDETTLKPARNQRFIPDETCYTAADATTPDGETFPALFFLLSGVDDRPSHVVCFGKQTIWSFHCHQDEHIDVNLTDEQRSRFPLRVCSRLSATPGKPASRIRFIVNAEGRVQHWEVNTK